MFTRGGGIEVAPIRHNSSRLELYVSLQRVFSIDLLVNYCRFFQSVILSDIYKRHINALILWCSGFYVFVLHLSVCCKKSNNWL